MVSSSWNGEAVSRCADPAHDGAEVGLAEDPVPGLGDDEGDGVGAARDERTGRPVGHVAEGLDGLLHRGAGGRRDLRGAVDHPRYRAAADAGEPGDLLDGGRTSGSRAGAGFPDGPDTGARRDGTG